MSLLSDIKAIVTSESIALPCEVGIYKATPAPEQYVVLDPLGDSFQCADDVPETEVQAVRVSLYSKTNYTAMVREIARALIAQGMTITDRRYITHEDDTGYYHYAIDVENNYSWEE